MIPFNRPSFHGNERAYLEQAIGNGSISGNGEFTKMAESALSKMHSGATALLTTNCTHALELSARLLNLQPDDEVIVPSYTFVSTASAFMWNGAKPVFADSRADTLNVDPSDVARLITARTKAICVVHYAGVGADPDAFQQLAVDHGITLIEDNAHGLGGHFDGRTLGTFGAMSTLSFHETKNLTCGEGGALILNDPSLVERAEILREKGTNRARFLRGQVDKYTWADVGSSWVMSDMLAATLVGQLERFDEIQAERMRLWLQYQEELAEWADQVGVTLPQVPELADHTAHMFYLRFKSRHARDDFIAHMRERDVLTVFHYQALHESPVGLSLQEGHSCPVASDASQTLVRLPLFYDLGDDAQRTVIRAATSFTNT
ncbi:MAG: dTDP-4-amino-4,6-dideoxygalactose transaminase [Candidatus Nanopelagicales bacterium]|nr:dTDP-4-amino-4,6-dideoxygalactose transaminase [Candidatus Nanopelagicales bacterium]